MSNRESAWSSSRFFHARTVARARARISKDGIRRWPCSLFAVSTCRRTAWTWWCCLRGGSFRCVTTQPAGPSWSQGCARSQSPQLALSRAVVTSAESSVPCSRRGCRGDVSTRTSFVSSPPPPAGWPRTTAPVPRRSPRTSRSSRRQVLSGEYVGIRPKGVVQRDAAVEKLAEIVTMRRQLCDEHVAAENQAAHLEDAMLRRLSKRRQMRLEADIRLLDKRLAEMVAANGA